MSSGTNKLVSTLSEINQDGLHSFSSANANSNYNYNYGSQSSSSGFFSNITWQTWLIVILILAFLGINVFSYLEMGTEKIADFFGPIFKILGYQTLETTKQTVEASAIGTKAGVDVIANTTTGTINAIENTAKSINNTNTNSSVGQKSTKLASLKNSEPIQDQLKMEKQINELEDLHKQNLQIALQDAKSPNTVVPDDSLSRIQASNGSGKAGWCFIGEDRGYRTCSEIGVNDKCMSGDIFPSQEICMNPNLRP
jgi:hypothetical protein